MDHDASSRGDSSLPRTNGFEPAQSNTDRQQQANSLAYCSEAAARAALPHTVATKLSCLPLGYVTIGAARLLTIAAPKDDLFGVQQQLKFYLGSDIKVVPMERAVISAAIFRAYKGDPDYLSASAQLLRVYDNQVRRVMPSDPAAPNLGPSAKFLEELLQYATARYASDVHIIPHREGSEILVRVDGELQRSQGLVCSLATHQEFVQRIKVLAQLDLAQRQLPQDGAFSLKLESEELRVRVNTLPTLHGEKVALRLLAEHRSIPFDELGLPMSILGWFEEILEQGEGTVLFAGPTGSGKSTTMYSFVRQLLSRGQNVVTIEDPVEAIIPGAAQLSVQPARGLTYPVAIRAALRQDPDAVLIGELRDCESAAAALQLSITGHLVVSTVHGGNVHEALLRLIQLGVSSDTIAHAISLIVALRLVPIQCGCREKSPNCSRCRGSGISGRQLVAEGLRITASVRRHLLQAGMICPEGIKALSSDSFVSAQAILSRLRDTGKIAPGVVEMLLKAFV